jgi:Co/Zn/Cd efflux system component
MKLHNTHLLIVATLTVLTNGFSLRGFNHGSAGALARNIECISMHIAQYPGSRNAQAADR